MSNKLDTPVVTAKQNFPQQLIEEIKEASIFEKIIYACVIFIPLTFVAAGLNFPPLPTFFISAFAIIPLAKFLGEATEALSSRVGTALGGLLNASFGNAVELIISIIALTKGLSEIVKASITGSIIGNILFVMGLSMFMGGLKRKHQFFNKVATSAASSQMTLACIALIIPAVFAYTSKDSPKANDLVENLSLGVAGILLISYLAQLVFFLRTHADLTAPESEEGEAPSSQELSRQEEQIVHRHEWSVTRAIVTLIVSTVLVGILSEVLVGSVEPLTQQLGWSELFVGVILIAIIGNAAEHMTAVTVAMKNKMDLAISIGIGSSTQIALFVAPVLVLVGMFIGHPINFNFDLFELAAIVVSVFILNLVTSDGESNWFEGLQLMSAYLIIAVAFFLHV
jgi:Ca2+:H+ antiporter